jgi:RES domain-containing protein
VGHDRKLLEALGRFQPRPWRGIVYRHMFANYSPKRENRLGARWNPPDVPAIYGSLARETAIAEAEYQISVQPLRPPVRRTIYRILVSLASVLDLSSDESLHAVGLDAKALADLDHDSCQRVGGAVEWLEHDGLLVPSARDAGGNLVIYPNQRHSDYEFNVLDTEVIFDPTKDSHT